MPAELAIAQGLMLPGLSPSRGEAVASECPTAHFHLDHLVSENWDDTQQTQLWFFLQTQNICCMVLASTGFSSNAMTCKSRGEVLYFIQVFIKSCSPVWTIMPRMENPAIADVLDAPADCICVPCTFLGPSLCVSMYVITNVSISPVNIKQKC